ncbi:hypothetical protein B5C34_03235 [Pacificimonas flava]|uniref:PEP-CTERM protein-sorting domain-containing protein n=2 Tax=Pacificimonas TaxID=1960290 RepID=A0A219B449_9SPHN|nr:MULTISPECIES: hypothetical protein [Pacificimonas]MBZ6377767.1 hypothetical protein [Pacificimonas aurantium]OWV32558.1 hypothetical protein B5C34_03235 [Pacificimonas flava]
MRILVAAIVSLLSSGAAHAAIVASSLPYQGTPDWTDVVFGNTSMTTDGSTTTLTTSPYAGVYFGNVPGQNAPAWSIGNSMDGNLLTLAARFGPGTADFSAYFSDDTSFASIRFGPTDCVPGNCYGETPLPGLSLTFAAPGDPQSGENYFVPLDLTQDNLFEIAMRDGLVSYRINGTVYSGAAQSSSSRLLVIGDGSGSTRTGEGSMTISEISFDNEFAGVLTGPDGFAPTDIPGPAAPGLLGIGVFLLAWRRRPAAR